MLTLEELVAFPKGEVFATGVLPNSPEELYMVDSDLSRNLRWIAKKGFGYDDWSLYCHWDDKDVEWIKKHGDKVTDRQNIQRCVPCEDDVMRHYRM